MNTLTRAKIVLALIGLVLFGAGVRLQLTELRWTGLGFVVIAWLLRFARARSGSETRSSTE